MKNIISVPTEKGEMMKNCKECLHQSVCELWRENELQDASSFQTSGCDYFRDRSRFVELPCKVGDMVHRKDGAWNVVGFECDRSQSWRIKLERWKDQFWDFHENTKIVFKSLGKTAFLSSEEAGKAFAEKEKK